MPSQPHVHSSAPAPLVPRSIVANRYALERVLYQAASGSTWLALDRHSLTRRAVALRIQNGAFESIIGDLDAFDARLDGLREVEAPGLPRLADFGWDADRFYAAFEFVEGESLDQLVAMRPDTLSAQDKRAIVRTLATATGTLHGWELLHLGLTLSNITYDTHRQCVRLIDWGHMVPVNLLIPEAARFPGISLDAVPYASRELLAGATPDARDDVYSVGCIAYEVLAAAHPYDRRPAALAAELGARPARLPELDRKERAAIGKALAIDRVERMATLGELAAAFATSRPSSWLDRCKMRIAPYLGRRQRPGIAMGLALVAGVAGYGAWKTLELPSSARPVAPGKVVKKSPGAAEASGPHRPTEDPDQVASALNRALTRTTDPAGSASTSENGALASSGEGNAAAGEQDTAIAATSGPLTAAEIAAATKALSKPGDYDSTGPPQQTGVPVGSAPRAPPTTPATVAVARPCPTCDCPSLEHKRTFTSEPLRLEEQTFLRQHCRG